MSYELVKFQSNEGYSYAPGGNKHINFSFDDPSVVDMSKSYVILNTSLSVTSNVAGSVVNPGLGPLGNNGTLDYKPISMIRNAKWSSESVKDFYVESRDVNIREINKQLYTKSLSDNQTDNLRGAGWSREDNITNKASTSVFLDQKTDGATLSSLKSADCIVPLSELYEDAGSHSLFPCGLMRMQNMELELEDRYNLVDVKQFTSNIDLLTDPGTVTNASAALKTIVVQDGSLTNNPTGFSLSDFYVGQPLQLEFDISAPAATTETGVVFIESISHSSTTDDGLGHTPVVGNCVLTLSETIGTLTSHTDGTDQTVDQVKILPLQTYTGTPTFTVNRAELVLARKRLDPKIVADYYSVVMKEGLRFSMWDTISWNFNNAVDCNEFWTLPANTRMVMNVKPGDNLFSLLAGKTDYRWTIDNKDTTNRDVTVANGNNGALYRHKLVSAFGAADLPVKQVGNKIQKSLAGSSPDNSLDSCIECEVVPSVNMPLMAKLRVKGAGMPLGPSYLFVLKNKDVQFN